MDFDHALANHLANAAMGWYSNSLSNKQMVEEVERALEDHDRHDLKLPPDIVSEILSGRSTPPRPTSLG